AGMRGSCASPAPVCANPIFFFSSRRRHTRWPRDWSSDVCSSDHVSRADASLVQRLFEMEVQEIYDGTVQIRFAAREAGERTKVRSEERRVGKECRYRWWTDV